MTTVFEDNSLCKCSWRHDALSCASSDLDVVISNLSLFHAGVLASLMRRLPCQHRMKWMSC